MDETSSWTHTSAKKGVNNDTHMTHTHTVKPLRLTTRDLSQRPSGRDWEKDIVPSERERARARRWKLKNTFVMLKHLWYIRVDIILIYFVILYTNHTFGFDAILSREKKKKK